jgi:hypothetical protein
MVRPSAASLNSLAEVLRQASPLYAECRSILNYLDREDGIVFLRAPEDSATAPNGISANKDADSIPQTILELTAPDRESIM